MYHFTEKEIERKIKDTHVIDLEDTVYYQHFETRYTLIIFKSAHNIIHET